MKPITLDVLGAVLGVSGLPAVQVQGAAIDSRRVQAGNLFVALAGAQTDGHDYLAQARAAGACAALVARPVQDSLPQLVVPDVTKAFAQLAQYWLAAHSVQVVAITGSNGKTTVKEMVSAILSQVAPTWSTPGNLNNDLGVPLTIFALQAEHQYAVIEMGASHAGDIARLVHIAPPDVAVLNNVGPAHLEGFGSLEGVARAKAEIYSGLKPHGIAIVNADMPYASQWAPILAQHTCLRFGLSGEADIKPLDLQLSATSSQFMVHLDGVNHFIHLPLPGVHNVMNALAAIAVAVAFKLDPVAIVRGLGSIQPVAHRLQIRPMVRGIMIDDTYNANPGSLQPALDALKSFPGEHWLVLGDFGELGADAVEIHRSLGALIAQAGVRRLITLGKLSRYAHETFQGQAIHFDHMSDLQRHLDESLHAEVVCLLKGSRFMQLDQLADALALSGEATC